MSSKRYKYHITPLKPTDDIQGVVTQWLQNTPTFNIHNAICTPVSQNQSDKRLSHKAQLCNPSSPFFIKFNSFGGTNPFEQPFTEIRTSHSVVYVFAYPCNNDKSFDIELQDLNLVNKFESTLKDFQKMHSDCTLEFKDPSHARLYYRNPKHIQPDEELVVTRQTTEFLYEHLPISFEPKNSLKITQYHYCQQSCQVYISVLRSNPGSANNSLDIEDWKVLTKYMDYFRDYFLDNRIPPDKRTQLKSACEYSRLEFCLQRTRLSEHCGLLSFPATYSGDEVFIHSLYILILSLSCHFLSTATTLTYHYFISLGSSFVL